jgi:hypothetical protein
MKALYLLMGLLAFGPTVALPQVAPVTAIKAGRLVDPEAGATTTNQVILVEGSKIVAVGADLRIPEGARVIDLSALTVLPGSSTAIRISEPSSSSRSAPTSPAGCTARPTA